jgi:hypothetical protein
VPVPARYRLLRVLGIPLGIMIGCAGCSSEAKTTTPTSVPKASTPSTLAIPSTTTPAVSGPVVRTGQQRLSPLYGQGVARIPGGWIFSGTNSLWRTDESLKEVVHTGPSIPEAWKAKGFTHIGDIDVVGKYIYAPFEQPDYAKGRQAMARFDRDSLRFVDAVMVSQHHNSLVSVDPATMTAYSTFEFDDDAILRYDVAHGWKPLAPLRMSRKLGHIQGADVFGGAIWISTDDAQRGVYRVDMKTGTVTQVATLGHAGGEGEGIDATQLASGFLHVLCVDKTFVPVWFEHFAPQLH